MKGSRRLTPVPEKSAAFRDTSVSPFTFAVAASRLSTVGNGRMRFSLPHSSATDTVIGSTRRPNAILTCVNHLSNAVAFSESLVLARSSPCRISPNRWVAYRSNPPVGTHKWRRNRVPRFLPERWRSSRAIKFAESATNTGANAEIPKPANGLCG